MKAHSDRQNRKEGCFILIASSLTNEPVIEILNKKQEIERNYYRFINKWKLKGD